MSEEKQQWICPEWVTCEKKNCPIIIPHTHYQGQRKDDLCLIDSNKRITCIPAPTSKQTIKETFEELSRLTGKYYENITDVDKYISDLRLEEKQNIYATIGLILSDFLEHGSTVTKFEGHWVRIVDLDKCDYIIDELRKGNCLDREKLEIKYGRK
jgi:hypothetical protein